jgi:hypothetical protein
MEQCDRLEGCGFFKKYRDRHVVACAQLIEEYCNDSEKSKSCARKKIFEKTGAPPPDDILPNGADVNDIA